MVNFGAVLTLGIVAAIGVIGYAVYRSGGSIGSALSRGVETTLVNPVTDWFDNLFKLPEAGAVSTTFATPGGNTTQDIIVQAGGIVPNPQFVDDPNRFNPPGVTGYGYPKTPQGEIINRAEPLPVPYPSPVPLPSLPTASLPGWYYQNFAPGGREDRQLLLKEGTATKLIQRGYDLTFLGISKLGPSGFELFGQSKGYL